MAGEERPGGPYPLGEGKGRVYFCDEGGRELQIMAGRGIVVFIVPYPGGGQLYTASLAAALGQALIDAAKVAAEMETARRE